MREAADILQNRKGKGLASALKTKRAGSDHIIGPLMEVDRHHADGQPVKLMMQVCIRILCMPPDARGCYRVVWSFVLLLLLPLMVVPPAESLVLQDVLVTAP